MVPSCEIATAVIAIGKTFSSVLPIVSGFAINDSLSIEASPFIFPNSPVA